VHGVVGTERDSTGVRGCRYRARPLSLVEDSAAGRRMARCAIRRQSRGAIISRQLCGSAASSEGLLIARLRRPSGFLPPSLPLSPPRPLSPVRERERERGRERERDTARVLRARTTYARVIGPRACLARVNCQDIDTVTFFFDSMIINSRSGSKQPRLDTSLAGYAR